MGKWWENKKEAITVWQSCKTPDGYDYFFNTVTNETSWEKPEELMTDDEKDAAVSLSFKGNTAVIYPDHLHFRATGSGFPMKQRRSSQVLCCIVLFCVVLYSVLFRQKIARGG